MVKEALMSIEQVLRKIVEKGLNNAYISVMAEAVKTGKMEMNNETIITNIVHALLNSEEAEVTERHLTASMIGLSRDFKKKEED